MYRAAPPEKTVLQYAYAKKESHNLYGYSFGGQPIQLQKHVYVAASQDDLDGDGVLNSAEPCLIIEASGQDVDRDGADDACDAVIGTAPPQRVSDIQDTDTTVAPAADVTVAINNDNLGNQASTGSVIQGSPAFATAGPHVQGATTVLDEAGTAGRSLAKRPAQAVSHTKHRFSWVMISGLVGLALLWVLLRRRRVTH